MIDIQASLPTGGYLTLNLTSALRGVVTKTDKPVPFRIFFGGPRDALLLELKVRIQEAFEVHMSAMDAPYRFYLTRHTYEGGPKEVAVHQWFVKLHEETATELAILALASAAGLETTYAHVEEESDRFVVVSSSQELLGFWDKNPNTKVDD